MLWLIAGALGLSALSLLLPWAIAFDPWAWISWGRDITHLSLDTSDGPSWKPLPVVATTIFSLAGNAAPVLWLLVARAGGLLALAGAAVLGNRLAGPLAGVIAAATMAVTNWWFFNTALGNSEPIFAAATLWAILAYLDGRPRMALWLAVAGGLMRPEAWPFIGLYVLWLWRTRQASVPELGSALGVLAVLWFGPDVIGAGGALGASEAALGPGSAVARVERRRPRAAGPDRLRRAWSPGRCCWRRSWPRRSATGSCSSWRSARPRGCCSSRS